MGYDYDILYAQTSDALGAPTQKFVGFFDEYKGEKARVLDMACGQGPDALFIDQNGRSVVGVDISPVAIDAILQAAKAENLNIEGVLADEVYILIDDEPSNMNDFAQVIAPAGSDWVNVHKKSGYAFVQRD